MIVCQQLHDPGQSLSLDNITRARGNHAALAAGLQRDGTAAFGKSWRDRMSRIASKNEGAE